MRETDIDRVKWERVTLASLDTSLKRERRRKFWRDTALFLLLVGAAVSVLYLEWIIEFLKGFQ